MYLEGRHSLRADWMQLPQSTRVSGGSAPQRGDGAAAAGAAVLLRTGVTSAVDIQTCSRQERPWQPQRSGAGDMPSSIASTAHPAAPGMVQQERQGQQQQIQPTTAPLPLWSGCLAAKGTGPPLGFAANTQARIVHWKPRRRPRRRGSPLVQYCSSLAAPLPFGSGAAPLSALSVR